MHWEIWFCSVLQCNASFFHTESKYFCHELTVMRGMFFLPWYPDIFTLFWMNRYGWNRYQKKARTLFKKTKTGPAVWSEVRDERAEARKSNQRQRKNFCSPFLRWCAKKDIRSATRMRRAPALFHSKWTGVKPRPSSSPRNGWRKTLYLIQRDQTSLNAKRASDLMKQGETGQKIRTVVTWVAQNHSCHPWTTMPCHPSLSSERSVHFMH